MHLSRKEVITMTKDAKEQKERPEEKKLESTTLTKSSCGCGCGCVPPIETK